MIFLPRNAWMAHCNPCRQFAPNRLRLMQSQRLSRILVLALAISQLHVSYGKPYTAQYRFEVSRDNENSLFYTFFKYHTGLLSGAGADTFKVTKIDFYSIEVSITGSLRALQRVQDSYCVKLTDAHKFSKKLTCLTKLPSERNNPEKEVGFNWPDMKEKNFVYIKNRFFLHMIAESV